MAKKTIYKAIKKGSKEVFQKELDKDLENINEKDDSGATLLHYATFIKTEDTFFVEELLKKKAEVNALNYEGATPLHLASFIDNTSVIQCLVENNASLTSKDLKGKNALETALSKDNISTARLLMKAMAEEIKVNAYSVTPSLLYDDVEVSGAFANLSFESSESSSQ